MAQQDVTPVVVQPTTPAKWMPALWSLITAMCGAFGIWAANEPGAMADLKIPAALGLIASAIAASKSADKNTEQAAKANPEHLADDNGVLDPSKTLPRLISNALENGEFELAESLTAVLKKSVPQAGGKR